MSKQHAAVSQRKSGRAAFNEDGRGVWEWQTAAGVFERAVSDEQLKRLEATEFTLTEWSAAPEGRIRPNNSEASESASSANRRLNRRDALRGRQRRSLEQRSEDFSNG
ncbi:MAG: hypothetical protein ACREV5_08955 [Steroidobacter sp.]